MNGADSLAAMSAALPPAMATVSTAGMLMRVLLGLGLVLGLLGAVLFLYRKATRGAPRQRGDATIELVSQRSLGARTSLAVVRVAGEVLLLGVTQQQVSALARLDRLAQEAQVGTGGCERGPGERGRGTREGDPPVSIPELGDFESALAGELQRVRRGLWTSLSRIEAHSGQES